MKERLYYLLFNILLIPGWICVLFLIRFSFLLKPKKKSQVLALYPYSQEGGDGYQRRFVEYLEALRNDGISFNIFDVCYEDDFRVAEKKRVYTTILTVTSELLHPHWTDSENKAL